MTLLQRHLQGFLKRGDIHPKVASADSGGETQEEDGSEWLKTGHEGVPCFFDEGRLPPQNSSSHPYQASDLLGTKVNDLLCLLRQSSATAHARQGLQAPSGIIPTSSGI